MFMNRSKKTVILLFFLFILIASCVAHAGDSGTDKKSIIGIQGYQVSVQLISPSLQKAGLTKIKIEQQINSKLTAAGIKTLNKVERSKAEGRPLFHVLITGFKLPKSKNFGYSIKTSVFQDVLLKRNQKYIMSAATWSKDFSGTSSLEDIKDILSISIDAFLKRATAIPK